MLLYKKINTMKTKILIIVLALTLSSCDKLMPKFENTTSKNYTLPDPVPVKDTTVKITENVYDENDKIISSTTVDLNSSCKDFSIQRIKLQIEMDIKELSSRFDKTWTKEEWDNFVKNSAKYSDLEELFRLNEEILCERYENYKNPSYFAKYSSELMVIDTNKKISFITPKKVPKKK